MFVKSKPIFFLKISFCCDTLKVVFAKHKQYGVFHEQTKASG